MNFLSPSSVLTVLAVTLTCLATVNTQNTSPLPSPTRFAPPASAPPNSPFPTLTSVASPPASTCPTPSASISNSAAAAAAASESASASASASIPVESDATTTTPSASPSVSASTSGPATSAPPGEGVAPVEPEGSPEESPEESPETDGGSRSGDTVGYVVGALMLTAVVLLAGAVALGVNVPSNVSLGTYSNEAGTGGTMEATGITPTGQAAV